MCHVTIGGCANYMLDEKLYELVKQRFEQHIDEAYFLIPIRVDSLQKQYLKKNKTNENRLKYCTAQLLFLRLPSTLRR